ncbi:MAG: hypothetical protein PHQ74_11305 [Crocinitomicaceae bacterium]|nr:hypothetical protein [Crocinitomicaceae bacterium]
MQTYNIGVIIQARLGSSRLPQKMLKPFFEDQTLLDVVLGKFTNFKYPIVLATSTSSIDDAIEAAAKDYPIEVFRGSETNVLKRFIDAAEKHKIDVVVRVCADNPFLSIDYIEDLIDAYQKSAKEYISFQSIDKIPTIRTHYGFFSELVELQALKKIQIQTEQSLYLEHVTNFIYENPDKFSMSFLPIPFTENEGIRLTVDTIEDFELCQEIYSNTINEVEELTSEYIVEYLLTENKYMSLMHKQIEEHKK